MFTHILPHKVVRGDMMTPLIFVIDDSLVVQKTLEISLRRVGVEVRGFNDGVEAMRWMMMTGACIPDLVFVDIGLPKNDPLIMFSAVREYALACQER